MGYNLIYYYYSLFNMGQKHTVPPRCIIVKNDDYTEYRWRNNIDSTSCELHIVKISKSGTLKQFCHISCSDSHNAIGQIDPPCDHRNDKWNFDYVKYGKKIDYTTSKKL